MQDVRVDELTGGDEDWWVGQVRASPAPPQSTLQQSRTGQGATGVCVGQSIHHSPP